jgi:hypothetical protein
MSTFRKATRKATKLKMALLGPSGSGKTYSAIQIARGLGDKIAMIDTENGSGEMYSDLCDYDVAPITAPFTPQKYIDAIREAGQAGYDVLIIDSLSHAWAGTGGLLEEVDKRKAGQKNQFAAWRDVTPMHNSLVEAVLQSPCHIITTMRTKTAYDWEKDSSGKLKPVKVGLAPIQRDGLEYEFTLVLDIENEKHMATPSKDRTSLFDGQYFVPSPETGQQLKAWLESGETPPEPPKADSKQVQRIQVLCRELGITEREDRLSRINQFLQPRYHRTVQSTKDLTPEEADAVIKAMDERVRQKQQESQQEAANA